MKTNLLTSILILLCLCWSNLTSAQAPGCVIGNATATNIIYKVNGVTVPSLNGTVAPGSTVRVTFKTATNSQPTNFSLVSYKAPANHFTEQNAVQQTVFDSETKIVTGGSTTHMLEVTVPNCYFQVDFVKGCVIQKFGPAGSNNYYGKQNRLIAFANGGSTACVTTPPPAVPCVKSDQCFDFAYSYLINNNGTVTIKFDVTINCNRDLSNVAFELPAGVTASAHTGSNTVENPTSNPFYSIKFEGLNGKNGTVKSFTYTISAAAFASMTTIRAYAKASGTVGQVTFNANGCGPTPPTCTVTANITGPDTVCAYSDEPYTFTTPAQTGATYVWTVPADWFIDSGNGTNSIVVYAGAEAGDVTVTVTNTCGTASDTQPVAVNEDCGLITPLPVELISFNGKASAEGIALNWATATEKNNDRFEVQRSTDGRSFETVGTVKGNGNSNARNEYGFTDKATKSGLNYYRLRQVDFNGEFEFSKVVTVTAKGSKEAGMVLYPNPSLDGVFNVKMAEATNATLQVMDLSGRTMFTKELKNSNEINIDGRSLGMKPGLYLVSLKVGNTNTVEKLIVR